MSRYNLLEYKMFIPKVYIIYLGKIVALKLRKFNYFIDLERTVDDPKK